METGKVALVLGVGGFLGRYVARHFTAGGWQVIGVDRHPSENAPLQSVSDYYAMDLPCEALATLVARLKPDVCVNCAGRASVPRSLSDPASDFKENTDLTFQLLNVLRTFAPACRFIYFSSAAVYGNPTELPITECTRVAPVSPYGFHKRLGEQLVEEFYNLYGLQGASLRIFSAYGPGLRRQVLWDICYKALVGGSVTLQGTGQETRDFIHAADVARAALCVANSAPMQGEVYNVASGEEITIQSLTECILSQLDLDIKPLMDGIVPPGTPRNWRADITKLKSLGYVPAVPLDAGVRSFVSWSRAELVG